MAEGGFLTRLFGWELKKKDDEKRKSPSVVPPNDVDGAGYVTAPSAGHFGQYVDIDGDQAKDNHQLIMKYRGMSMHPEVDMAIEEIVNEAIAINANSEIVNLLLENIEVSEKIKDQIREEFNHILSLLSFHENAHDLFRRWYVDGRLIHHVIIDAKNERNGILELRFMDASKIRKIREVKWKKDLETGANIVDSVDEYYLYQDKPGSSNTGLRLTPDSISYVTSGLLDESRKKVVSHLHKALKPLNQLRMMEDSLVIYRLARAPERRIFYIDVGNLPRGKADEYMKSMMTKYRNKLVYDSNTGQLKDDRKHMSMLEDFWLPRKEGGRGTEISSLPGGENLGQIEDIIYFQKRLYRSLNVPINRLEQESQFSLGRSTEISRDEVKFQKFIDRLRLKFSRLFLDLLRKQLILKGMITEDDWSKWKTDIFVDFVKDNHFSELKDSEILREKVQTLDMINPYVGEYFTKEYVLRNVLRYNQDEIDDLQKDRSKNPGIEGDGDFEGTGPVNTAVPINMPPEEGPLPEDQK
jgi:hypothetical protein